MSLGRFLRRLTIVLALMAVAVWCVTRWVAIPWVVDGPSMEPTLVAGDRVLVDLWTFRRRLPRARDIVVIRGPGDEALVKRVAPEPYPGNEQYARSPLAVDPLEPSFVVLGDNPAQSHDSRTFGRIPSSRIRGRVFWRYWPPSRAGWIE